MIYYILKQILQEKVDYQKKYVEIILIKNYPSWSFLDVSKEGYEADCKAFETPTGQILYEFKNYDYNVNRDQVNKFIRDLNHTNIKYGIFVSNTSGIVGNMQY